MASKQQKKKQAIRQKQTEIKSGSAYEKALKDFRDEKERWYGEAASLRSNLMNAEHECRDAMKDATDALKSLKHERRLRQDVQNGAVAAKESVRQIRELHVISPSGEVCVECHKFWPCPTILAIREPLQETITGLLILEHALSDPGK